MIAALGADEAGAAVDALLGNVFGHTPDGTAYRISLAVDATPGDPTDSADPADPADLAGFTDPADPSVARRTGRTRRSGVPFTGRGAEAGSGVGAGGRQRGRRLRRAGGGVATPHRVARLVVDDAGPGIADPEAVLARGHSDARSTGLGLDIAHRAAEAAGGRLTIARSPLGGARVTLTFPEPSPQ